MPTMTARVGADFGSLSQHKFNWNVKKRTVKKKKYIGGVTSNYHIHAVSTMRLPKWKRKGKKNNVRINGQNREDAYSSIARQGKRIEIREKALRTHSHHPNLPKWIWCRKKKTGGRKKIALRFLFCFVLCSVFVWCRFDAGFFGTVGETAYQLGLHFICAWLKEEQNMSQTEKVKEIAGAYHDRIKRIWSSGEVDRTRNSSKWSFHAVDEMRENSHDRREFVCRQRSRRLRWRRRRLNYYAFNNKAPQIKRMAKNAPSLCALGNWFTFLNAYKMHTAAVSLVRFCFYWPVEWFWIIRRHWSLAAKPKCKLRIYRRLQLWQLRTQFNCSMRLF